MYLGAHQLADGSVYEPVAFDLGLAFEVPGYDQEPVMPSPGPGPGVSGVLVALIDKLDIDRGQFTFERLADTFCGVGRFHAGHLVAGS